MNVPFLLAVILAILVCVLGGIQSELNSHAIRNGLKPGANIIDLPGLPVIFAVLICTGLIIRELRAMRRK